LPGELFRADVVSSKEVTTAGYLLAESTGTLLVDSVVFEADGRPRPLDSGIDPIWLGANTGVSLENVLHSAGGVRYAAVIVRGRLEGPGAYGASGQYRYQIPSPRVEPLAPQETTVGDLLDQPATYAGRPVRIVGGLLVREKSALLVDRLGSGGLPEPKARQIKLRTELRDEKLLGRLDTGGAVRYGQVQIEGFWRAGSLTLLSITVIL
jgi:hypothetical protein